MTDAARIEKILGNGFSDRDLLTQALTHRSYCSEHSEATHNERLEFLGDAVLGLVVADEIFGTYPEMPEGELAKVRAAVVNAAVLAEVGTEIDLGENIRLGKGEAASGGAEKVSILADTVEALIAAIYLDQGYGAARTFILRQLGARILEAAAVPGSREYKSLLQELATRTLEMLPRYVVTDEGPDHAKHFTATVFLAGIERGVGEGPSKKIAEQKAAHVAWLWLAAGDEPSISRESPEDSGQESQTEPLHDRGRVNARIA